MFFGGVDEGVTVRNWLTCGPFGGGIVRESVPQDAIVPEKLKAIQGYFAAAAYPPDEGDVDLGAVFSGAMVQGWWKDPGGVKWTPAVVADQDTRVTLGTNEGAEPASLQCWYGVTWIHAPARTELGVRIPGTSDDGTEVGGEWPGC